MLPVIDRAAAVLSRQSVAALPVGELARLVSESGTPVSPTVLLRTLAAEPDRFRVLDPLKALSRGSAPEKASGNASRQKVATAVPATAARQHRPGWKLGEAWVLAPPARAAAPLQPPEQPALSRLRASLVGLGWELDATSTRDLTRWAGMVLEGERFRLAVLAQGREEIAAA